ncbi:MAG TPA: TonB family protein [Gammaproteobacteria bacterium]|nr:TonB family protein [Gammaproteobacteria bacterium]
MVYSHSLSLPWSASAEDERRFRKILGVTLALTIALGIALPLLPVFKKPVEQTVELPPRVAKLIFEKRTEPKPVPKPVEKPKPEPKPKPLEKKKPLPKKKAPPKVAKKKPVKAPEPKVDAIEQARRKASTSGLLALQDSLADLRDQSVDELSGSRRLSNSGAHSRRTERALVTSKIAAGSRGINTSRLSRDAGSTHLAARTATKVKSSIAPVKPSTRRHGKKHSASRSMEEIQIVFDRNKAAIYSLYNRALRKNPALRGKVVLRLTIAPSGKVSKIAIVSSELGDPKLEHKLLRRIKMFNFGAKAVDSVTLTYPIDFLPA